MTHLGPDGNYLAAFAEDYFTNRHKTDWGRASIRIVQLRAGT